MPSLHFDTIDVIEWLGPDDGKTGWRLFEDLQPIGLLSRPLVTVRHSRVTNRAEFLLSLERIALDAKSNRHSPVIHIETHGIVPEIGLSPGIGLSSADMVAWAELSSALVPISAISGVNTLVILAACEGAGGVQMLQPTERAPFFLR